MKILITGSQGFLGKYLMENIVADGWDVLESETEDITLFTPNLNYDIVINCAVEINFEPEMVETNVLGVENLARYCKRVGAKLIHFSSVSIYGSSWYGKTKKMGEEVIRKVDPGGWVILRMTNIYAPGNIGGDSPACRFDRGEKDIFGNGYGIKDHIHIKDVLQAVNLAIKDDWKGEINLSSGKPSTINEIFKRLGSGVPNYIDKKNDLSVSVLDNSQALLLGWQPTWDIYQERIKNEM